MKAHRVKPNTTITLNKIASDTTGAYDPKDDGKLKAQKKTDQLLEKLRALQERLYASNEQALLIILQGMDTSGKDGTIKHVMSGVNPQGCAVTSFKTPSSLELAHDFLWRVHREAPAKGRIGLFNRSHYEDVLITRVHGLISDKVARERLQRIREFEYLLHQNDTRIVKVFLHISKDEQRNRLEARLRDPEKQWKFNPNDLAERKLWDRYQCAYEEAISASSTREAPWYIVPADYKWYRNLVVAQTVVAALKSMKLRFPSPPPGVDLEHLTIE